MLEDSLDHGREHLDDHHGPGPLSAVLGRQEDMVGAEPRPLAQGAWGLGSLPNSVAWLCVHIFGGRKVGEEGSLCLLFILILKSERVSGGAGRRGSDTALA